MGSIISGVDSVFLAIFKEVLDWAFWVLIFMDFENTLKEKDTEYRSKRGISCNFIPCVKARFNDLGHVCWILLDGLRFFLSELW